MTNTNEGQDPAVEESAPAAAAVPDKAGESAADESKGKGVTLGYTSFPNAGTAKRYFQVRVSFPLGALHAPQCTS
jgi:hypothetical protein